MPISPRRDQELLLDVCLGSVLRVLRPETTEEAAAIALNLGKALWKSCLRWSPLALRGISELGGSAAELEAMNYLADVGFPRNFPALPKHQSMSTGGRRITPPFVRRYWEPVDEAVSEVLNLDTETQQALNLSISWALVRALSWSLPWYQTTIERLSQEGWRDGEAVA